MRGILLGLALVFSLGVAVGNANDPAPKVEYRTKTEIKTVTETETVEVQTPPPAECAEAIDIAFDILKAGQKIDNDTSSILDLIADLRIAIATQSTNDANTLETKLRGIQYRTLGAAEKFGAQRTNLIESANACKEGLD